MSCKMFFEAPPGVKGASSFTNVELSALGAMNERADAYSVVRQAVELLRDGIWDLGQ